MTPYHVKAYLLFLKKAITKKPPLPLTISDILTHCFKNRSHSPSYTLMANYRKSLYSNNTTIKVTDFGAGSRVFKSNERQISKIAKNAGITKKHAQLLYKLTQHLKFKNILELGTSLGLATSAFSLANPKAKIITIEGCPETAKIAQQHFNTFKLHNIDLKVNSFNNEITQLKNQHFDCIYIDGNHQKEATLSYFNTLLNCIHPNSIIIFDDIHWSKNMSEAWSIIKKHSKVTTTIDTFFWGIVFFNNELNTQHLYLNV